jgi:hypothetical protein
VKDTDQHTGHRLLLAVGAALLFAFLAILALPLGNQVRTLLSFRRVDDYPLYVMHLYGEDGLDRLLQEGMQTGAGSPVAAPSPDPQWACTVFAALNGAGDRLLGRNFDWFNRPALVLFTHPPDGFDSVSLVDISYLGFGADEPSWRDRLRLLEAGVWPFDGMNEHGLAVGMMAVPHAEEQVDPRQTTIGSLHAMRLILDRARTVDEAIAHLQNFNVDFEGGPPLHYLIADAAGNSAIVEFIRGETVILPSDSRWQVATNFAVAGHSIESARAQCPRYALADSTLRRANGLLSQAEAMDLLEKVSQPITMWSVVYSLTSGEVTLAMGREYGQLHRFRLPMKGMPGGLAE